MSYVTTTTTRINAGSLIYGPSGYENQFFLQPMGTTPQFYDLRLPRDRFVQDTCQRILVAMAMRDDFLDKVNISEISRIVNQMWDEIAESGVPNGQVP